MSRLTKPRFSIVIPCYNEVDFLAATLRSLALQKTTEEYEIIVVDNNCNDGTAELAKSFAARVVTEKRRGVCWARQAGTEAARGEIIVSTDADTLFSPKWLDVIDRKFKQDERVVAVSGICDFYGAPWWEPIYNNILFYGVVLSNLITGRPCYITAANTAFKKSAWQRYDVSMTQGGDELDLLRQLRKAGKVQFVGSNRVYTSSRRLKKGLMYNLVISLMFYYFGAYYINKLFKRPLIGTAPAFRSESSSRIFGLSSGNLSNFALSGLVLMTAIIPVLRNGLFDVVYGFAGAAVDTVKFVL